MKVFALSLAFCAAAPICASAATDAGFPKDRHAAMNTTLQLVSAGDTTTLKSAPQSGIEARQVLALRRS